jgi:prolyl-tRNA synthetase
MADLLPKRSEDFAAWYNELVKKAGLAENSPVRGCMTVKPYGYAIWEKMKAVLDKAFKDTGHENAYFPLFIPKSFLSSEADHIEGFAKECAVVTHYRLKTSLDGGVVVDPEAKLEEELIVRPTSETIIWKTYKGWIQSYRDLPLLINQWSNVVRWEMRTRLFLRTTEILWQEGHTAHATKEEAEAEAKQMLEIYYNFAKEYLAMPLIKGMKTANEKFAGAETTYTIEALMQDGKALQAGTSHFLGQKFAKAFDVQFANAKGELEYVWGSSWGVTTRLVGALVMTHSDDYGLVLPPNIAPIQIVIVPIYKADKDREGVLAKSREIKAALEKQNITVKLDDSDLHTPGWKFADYELKGVPIRISVGARDLQNNTLEIVRRDTKQKIQSSLDNYFDIIPNLLLEIQDRLYKKALYLRDSITTKVSSYSEFKNVISEKGGFVLAHWDGTTETEKQIKADTKATIRCIPLDGNKESGKCMVTGNPSKQMVIFAQAY